MAKRTNLEVPDDLREEIEAEAEDDLRTYKPQIIVLLREAIAARKKKKARADE